MTRSRAFSSLLSSLSFTPSPFPDKTRLIRDNFYMLLNKTARMFEYDNLPATLPQFALELLLQIEGSAVIYRVPSSYVPVGFGPAFSYTSLQSSQLDSDTSSDTSSNIYAFSTNFAEAPDPYDNPYKVVITSPGFRPSISETLEINKDVIVMRNDTHMRGLYRLHKKYASLLTEAELSLNSTLIVLRDQMTFVAKTKSQYEAVSKYLSDREEGKIAAILAADLGNPLEALQKSGNSTSNAVELAVNGRQAIYAAWYNEMGLNPSFSLKREYTSAEEIGANTDLLMPTIDDMFYCRKLAVEQINALFGTNISVRKSSAWEQKERQTDIALDTEQANLDLIEAQVDAASSQLDTDTFSDTSSDTDDSSKAGDDDVSDKLDDDKSS